MTNATRPAQPAVGNPERGEIDIIVNGQHYVVRPNLNALAKAETMTGKKAPDLMREAYEGGVGAAIALVWSYLQKYHAAQFTTFDQAGDWIEEIGGLEALNEKLKLLTKLNTEEVPSNPTDAQDTEPAPLPTPGIGVNSSSPVLQPA